MAAGSGPVAAAAAAAPAVDEVDCCSVVAFLACAACDFLKAFPNPLHTLHGFGLVPGSGMLSARGMRARVCGSKRRTERAVSTWEAGGPRDVGSHRERQV